MFFVKTSVILLPSPLRPLLNIPSVGPVRAIRTVFMFAEKAACCCYLGDLVHYMTLLSEAS